MLSEFPRSANGCEIFGVDLAEMADGTDTDWASVDTLAGRHVAACLRCQAEVAQYRKLRRALAGLRNQRITPDGELLDEILTAIRPPASVQKLHKLNYRNRKVAYIGGIAAAATGAAAGALVLATKMSSKQKLAS